MKMKKIKKSIPQHEQETLCLIRKFNSVEHHVIGEYKLLPNDMDTRQFVWIEQKPKGREKAAKNNNFYYYTERDYSALNTKLNELYFLQPNHDKFIEDRIRDYNFDLTHENKDFKRDFGPALKDLKVAVDEESKFLKQTLQNGKVSTYTLFELWFEKLKELSNVEPFLQMCTTPKGKSVFNYTIATQFAYFVARHCDPFKDVEEFKNLLQYLNTFLNPADGLARQRSLRAVVRGRDWRPVDVENIYSSVEALAKWCKNSDGKIGPIEKAIILHNEIIRIQPFSDGNHRTARLLANVYLMHCGMPPIHIVNQQSRDEYDRATDRAIEQHNLDEEIEYFEEAISNATKQLTNSCEKLEEKGKTK